MAILIDTSVLLAAAFSKDGNHQIARQQLRSLTDKERIVVSPVLSELFYMATIRINYARAIQVFARTRTTFQIADLIQTDMLRLERIMAQYSDAQFDFVDVSIMALAERMNIVRICTFDRRDFSIFRPSHCDYLELFP